MEKLSCPLPAPADDRILLAHGGGGRLMHELIARVFRPAFGGAEHDGAVLPPANGRLAFTTDSYVVKPLIFPGGTIGDLAVNGTVNDLAMCGARPLWLSAGFILEEGLEMGTLRTIVESVRRAAERAGVQIVTGDTKVVDKGKGDGLFLNTAGIGLVEAPGVIGPSTVQAGDAVLLSGDLGSHGIAILSVREGLEFDAPIESDTAPLWEPVAAMLHGGIDVHCLRDLTRGGLASALNEIAMARGVTIRIEEARIPVRDTVRGACELLGLDPLYVACEGRFVAFVPQRQAELALALMGSGAAIGTVEEGKAGAVVLRTRVGGQRVVDMLSGEQLPRIC